MRIDELLKLIRDLHKEAYKSYKELQSCDYDYGFYAGRYDAYEDLVNWLEENPI